MPNVVLRKMLIISFDVLGCVLCAAILAAGIPEFAFAYVDPSVMTYAIQAVAGAAVALSAVVGVAFRKSRKWLFAKLGIDADSKRARDVAWVEIAQPGEWALSASSGQFTDHDAEGEGSAVGSASGVGKRRGSWADASLKWSARFAISFLVVFMAVGTLLLMAPIEIVAGGGHDFTFSHQEIAPLALVETLLVSLICALGISAIRGKAFFYAVGLVFAVGLGFFVQAMFLNVGLPIADGSKVKWSRYSKITIASAAVWVAIAVLALVGVNRLRTRIMPVFVALASVLIFVQGVGAVSLLLDDSTGTLADGSPASRKIVANEEGMFDIGEDNNVIVFVLDTYDTAAFKAALEQDPSIADELTGFTWYDNVCGSMIPTRYGLPFLLTDERPREDDKWSTFLKERYNRSSFLSDLADLGYSTGLYTRNLMTWTTTPEIAREKVANHAINLNYSASTELDTWGATKAMAKMALYRDLPWVLKRYFWFDTDGVVNAMAKEGSDDPSKTEYFRDDVGYYERLKEKGLVVADRGAEGTFRFIHLSGAHPPYVVNAEGQLAEKGDVTETDQAIGSLRIAEYYLGELKRLGAYDEATIILTADHGRWVNGRKPLAAPTSPFILFKPSQSAQEAAQPMATSHAPVMHDDVVPTIIDAIGGDAGKYAGKPLSDYTGDEDPNAPRYCLDNQCVKIVDYEIVEYAIRGDVLDFDNWEKTGRVWNAQE